MNVRLGPETRAIIEAIHELKPSHENLNYLVITIDLTVARANELYELPGWFYHLAVGKITGQASIRLNEATKDSMDLAYVRTVSSPIRRFFITNVAQAGCEIILGVGMDTTFADPMRQGLGAVFRYVALDEDGVLNIFETSQAKTVLPTFWLAYVNRPSDMQDGRIHRIHYRLNPTNAVTYTLRIWSSAINGAVTPYLQEVHLLWESPAGQGDDVPYEDVELDIPFHLGGAGLMYYSIEWTGAPGNTMGVIEVTGERET